MDRGANLGEQDLGQGGGSGQKDHLFTATTVSLWWGWCATAAKRINGTEVVFHGDPVPVGENAVVLLNHQEMTDVCVMFALAQAKERLGDLKWFVKDIVKYVVPGVGWGMLFLDCLYASPT